MTDYREFDLIPIEEARTKVQVSPNTLRRRIASGEIEVFRDGRDRRRRLVRMSDVERAFSARPIRREEQAA